MARNRLIKKPLLKKVMPSIKIVKEIDSFLKKSLQKAYR